MATLKGSSIVPKFGAGNLISGTREGIIAGHQADSPASTPNFETPDPKVTEGYKTMSRLLI